VRGWSNNQPGCGLSVVSVAARAAGGRWPALPPRRPTNWLWHRRVAPSVLWVDSTAFLHGVPSGKEYP